MYVFDRVYLDYERFYHMTDDGYFFLSRLRKNAFIQEEAKELFLTDVEGELSVYFTYPGGFYPSFVTSECFNGFENTDMSQEAVENLEHYWIDEMADQFITRQIPFTEWDTYVEKINEMNLEDYMSIQESAFERKNKSK